jgi:hypothetical protein
MGLDALVIGNGESRSAIDLLEFSKDYVTVGCNAIHRDFTVDHLVCCDARMVREALENPATDNSKIYVRDNWHQYFRKILKNKHIQLVPEIPYQGIKRPDNPIHWGSGPYAVLVAASLGTDSVSLLGFDLYGNQSLVNNVYKDSDNYKGSQTAAVDPSYWIYQISKVFDYFPKTRFNIINKPFWKMPEEWQKNNVQRVDI